MTAGRTSVMAQRAPAIVDADDELTATYRRLDFVPTPPWGARVIGEIIRDIDRSASTIWEPACGQGHMAAPLIEMGFDVFASDVHGHGYGQVIDFLDPAAGGAYEPDWVVSNPPFRLAGEFVSLGLQRARRGVAMLLRLQALEGVGRYELLYGAQPMTIFAPFVERLPMVLGRWDPEASTATAYAWFIWSKTYHPSAEPVIRPVAPGTKRRLTKGNDAARFGASRPAPLLDGGAA